MEEEFDFNDILDYIDPSVPSKAKENTFQKTWKSDYLRTKNQKSVQDQLNTQLGIKATRARQKNWRQVMTGGKDMFDFTDILDQENKLNRNVMGPYRGSE